MRLLHDNSLLNPYYLDWSCRWHRLVVFIATIASKVTLTHWYLMVSNLLGEREQALTVSCTGMSWPLTANRGCDWKLKRKKCHGLHLYYPHKRAYSNATRGGTCLKHAPQKGLLAVPGSSCVSALPLVCQTHLRSSLVTETCRGSQTWESDMWPFKRKAKQNQERFSGLQFLSELKLRYF